MGALGYKRSASGVPIAHHNPHRSVVYDPSFHFIFYVLVQLILHSWGSTYLYIYNTHPYKNPTNFKALIL